jgi:Leucine-rich repeat (LRR) protein
VAKNKLKFLTPELAACLRLDTVDARGNLLASIPAELAGAPRLRSLLLDNNRITLVRWSAVECGGLVV